MNGDISLSQALGGLRIANPDGADQPDSTASNSDASPPNATVPTASASDSDVLTKATSDDLLPPPSQPLPHHSQPELTRYSAHGLPASAIEASAAAPMSTSPYPSRHSSQRDPSYTYGVSRQASAPTSSGGVPPRKTSRGQGGGYAAMGPGASAPYAGDAPVPTTSAEWQERGAAVGVRREVDANGRTVVRQVKKGVRDFSFGRVLGEGSYSSVYHATDRQTMKEYAIKVLEKRHIIKEKKIKYVNIEKNTLNRLTEHPGVVRLYYTFQDETSLYYVLDLCNGGELLGVLKKTGTFDVECTRFYAAQILDAIDYMHSRGVIHRDLKPENVLLDDGMHVKITDFGTAKLLKDPREAQKQDADRGMPDPGRGNAEDDEGRAASFVGTAEYVSPELLTNKNACKASDLWAFGCIIYQLLAGRPPFKAGSEYLTFQKIVNLEYEFPQGFPPAARDLVERLLVLDPSRRLMIEHIKNHEFFDGQPFGKGLWRNKAPRLRPYVPPTPEPTVIQLNGGYSSAPQPIPQTRQPPAVQHTPSNGGNRPARLITELPPPTQLDIEWSPVLTKPNERILRLGDLMVVSSPIPGSQNGKDEPKKLSRFFGGSTTKKRQRLVMITSSGRIILAPAGGEDKRTKQELSLTTPDCTWKTQQDAKGQLVWCVDTVSTPDMHSETTTDISRGGHHYVFEDTKNTTSSDDKRASADEWIECIERAREYAASQSINTSYHSESGFADMPSAMSSPSGTLAGARSNGNHDGHGHERYGRSHLSKSQVSLDDPTPAPKRNRFSKRQSRNGLDSNF